MIPLTSLTTPVAATESLYLEKTPDVAPLLWAEEQNTQSTVTDDYFAGLRLLNTPPSPLITVVKVDLPTQNADAGDNVGTTGTEVHNTIWYEGSYDANNWVVTRERL